MEKKPNKPFGLPNRIYEEEPNGNVRMEKNSNQN